MVELTSKKTESCSKLLNCVWNDWIEFVRPSNYHKISHNKWKSKENERTKDLKLVRTALETLCKVSKLGFQQGFQDLDWLGFVFQKTQKQTRNSSMKVRNSSLGFEWCWSKGLRYEICWFHKCSLIWSIWARILVEKGNTSWNSSERVFSESRVPVRFLISGWGLGFQQSL